MPKRDDFETPPGKVYEGPSGVARDSVWLTNEDLPHDRDTTLKIEAVVRRDNVKFQGGRAKPIMLSLRFEKVRRELGLNATNRKVLNALFGSRCKDWVGHKVTLFVQQDVGYPNGTTGPAVRIRARRVDQSAATTPPPESPPDQMPLIDPEADKDML